MAQIRRLSLAEDGAPLVEAMPAYLLEEPLEFIFADHFRQRSVCSLLRQIAEGRLVPQKEANEISLFLAHDLPLHHADEEQDLFPALLKSARPEDDIQSIVGRLNADHLQNSPEAARVRDILTECAREAKSPARRFSAILREYALSENRHLAIENGLVLPIARVRLTKRQLQVMSQSMAARRGVILP